MPVIRTRDLTKRYGKTVGLEGLDLAVESGEVFGFLGPNGAGKTTAIRLLLDLIRPTHGEALVFGRPVGDPALRERIGYLPGELVLDGRMTGHATLKFLGALSRTPIDDGERRGELCEQLGLAGADLDRRVREYSRGMKQKLGLVAAFQHDPDLLILDEPTEGLDPLVRETVFEMLAAAKRAGKTVFHSSHVLSEIDRTCDRVGIVRAGRLMTVQYVDQLRRTSVRRMELEFDGPAPVDELQLPGVELIEHDGRHVVLRVAGQLDPLVAVLARHSVRQMVFPEPSLNEAFARFYEAERGGS